MRAFPFSVPLLLAMLLPVSAASVPTRASVKLRYEHCLSQANLNPNAALAEAAQWEKQKGAGPAEHCAAMALINLKRYPEAATRLDALGRAPGMGDLRPQIFDQAGNAWMLAGDSAKAVDSFTGALTLSAGDADLYADLARAQAMRKNWSEVEADLNSAIGLQPKRPDLLVLRASARQALHKLKQAHDDANAALAIRPNYPEALVQRGEISHEAGDLAGARRDFETVLKVAKAGEATEAARAGLEALNTKN